MQGNPRSWQAVSKSRMNSLPLPASTALPFGSAVVGITGVLLVGLPAISAVPGSDVANGTHQSHFLTG